jgi:hypothetical protein
MKILIIGGGFLVLLGASLWVKSYQFEACRADGMSHGTCWALISR